MSENPNRDGGSPDAYSCCMLSCLKQLWKWGKLSLKLNSLLALTGMTLVISSVSGCLPETKPGFNSPAPSKRLDAIVEASTLEDDESLVKLVEKLRSHDPAERMFAIRSLEIRTNETMEYDHAAAAWKRVEAVDRWIEYLNDRGIETNAIMDDGEKDQNDPMEQDTEAELSPKHSND